eukprot:CAMPEP_0114553954 /NCGR_PEP_ID=MMETSP0114-20121206/7948_1 /TAXON_ID=31324 /ORGANISM="Goniomonas sp, Strain m" /LENGTH=429 /DNA_ID=CAMNT_0001738961 /DNA_START=146 /DNA_END=1435 /DNA_ORIENTATION=+
MGDCYCGASTNCKCENTNGDCYCQNSTLCVGDNTNGDLYCKSCDDDFCSGSPTNGERKNEETTEDCPYHYDGPGGKNLKFAPLILGILTIAIDGTLFTLLSLFDAQQRKGACVDQAGVPQPTRLSAAQRRTLENCFGPGEQFVWGDTPGYFRSKLILFIVFVITRVGLIAMGTGMLAAFTQPFFAKNAPFVGSLLAALFCILISVFFLISLANTVSPSTLYCVSTAKVYMMERRCLCYTNNRTYALGALPRLELKMGGCCAGNNVGSVIFDQYFTQSTDQHGHTSTSRVEIGFKAILQAQEVEQLIRSLGGGNALNTVVQGLAGMMQPMMQPMVQVQGYPQPQFQQQQYYPGMTPAGAQMMQMMGLQQPQQQQQQQQQQAPPQQPKQEEVSQAPQPTYTWQPPADPASPSAPPPSEKKEDKSALLEPTL